MFNRDTKKFYIEAPPGVASGLLNFIQEQAGETILDAAAATGDYVKACIDIGFEAQGIDINKKYVSQAKKQNIPVTIGDATNLEFGDNSFDTVLLFELLEHIGEKNQRKKILSEANRVARKNVLITTPNSNYIDLLYRAGLTYEHMLDQDHKVLWNDKSIESEVREVFNDYHIQPMEDVEGRLFLELFNDKTLKAVNKILKHRKYRYRIFCRYYITALTD